MMSKLTINSVYTKEQIYPMLLNFQNGYPSEDFQVDCVLLQDEGGNSTVVSELDGLLYAGEEEKDLGQTFILARNRKTGNVRLIETGRADLKPVKKCTILQLEAKLLKSSSQIETEQIEPALTQLQESCVINSDIPKHPDTGESLDIPSYPVLLETSESYTTTKSHQLKTNNMVPDREKCPQPIGNSDFSLNIQFSKQTKHATLTELELDKPNHPPQPQRKKSKRKHSRLEISEPKTNQTELEPNEDPGILFPKHRLPEISALEATVNQSELESFNHKLNRENQAQYLEQSELDHNEPACSQELELNRNRTNLLQHLKTNALELRPNFSQLPISDQWDSNKDCTYQKQREFKSNGTDPNHSVTCKKTIIVNGSQLQMSEHNLETEKSQKYTHLGETELTLDKNMSSECMHVPDILKKADFNASIEEEEINDRMLTRTKENNLKTAENEKLDIFKDKDLSEVNEMFVKVNLFPEEKIKQNNVYKNISKNTDEYRNSGTHNQQHMNFEDEIWIGDDKISFRSKPYLCAHCDNRFQDKGSIIFHLLAHKFIRNTKSAVLVPLVKRLVEGTYVNSYKDRKKIGNTKKEKKATTNNLKLLQDIDNKIIKEANFPKDTVSKNAIKDILAQGTENKKEKKENFSRISVNNNASDLATSNEKDKTLFSQKEIEELDDCAIHLQNEKHSLKPNQKLHETNLTCDYCKKIFGDKGSLIFHFVVHKCTSDASVEISKIKASKNKLELNHKGMGTVCANKSEENDMVKKGDMKNDSILSETNMNINLRDDIIIETGKVAMIHETLKYLSNDSNDDISDQRVIVTCNDNIDVTAAIHEGHVALKVACQNDEATTIHEQPIPIDGDTSSKVTTIRDIVKVPIDDDIRNYVKTVTEARKVQSDDNNVNVMTNYDKEKNKIVEIHEERDSNICNNGILASRMKNEQNETLSINKENINHDNTFICNSCDRKFKSKVLLITHIKRHSKNSSVIVQATNNYNITKSPKRSQLPNQGIKGNKIKFCILCNYKTAHSGRLARHMRVHNNKCDYCEKEYRNIYDLQLHIRSHTGEKPFQCTQCDTRFASKINLNRHFKTHTQEKSYKCTLCTAKFKFAGGLTRHLNIHTKEKTYKCITCGSSFNDGSSLKRHVGCHTGEKPYSCDYCKYKTANGNELKKHMDTHTERSTHKFKCTICDFSTNLRSTLKLHMTRHTGEKPYSCDRCKYATAHKSDLKRHAKIHTKIRTK